MTMSMHAFMLDKKKNAKLIKFNNAGQMGESHGRGELP